MPTIQLEKERALCPPGSHILQLVEVAQKEVEGYNGEGPVPKFLWRFESDQTDEDGQLYELTVFTGLSYGNPKARLTWLLDLLVPGITRAEAAALNTDLLIGTRYEARIKHSPGQRDPSKKFAEIQYLTPLVDKTSAHGTAETDPFEQE